MRIPVDTLSRAITHHLGPWPCEECGQLSQYAEVRSEVNHVYCKNEACRFERIVDKRRFRIVENDGTTWEYDGRGAKRQVRSR
jgi:hypothetical protein